MSILPRGFFVVCAAALVAAPAAFATVSTRYGPDLQVTGQGVGKTTTTSVALKLALTPTYSTPKPGVVVTMRSCNNATLRLLRRVGALGSGQSLQARRGRIVWTIGTVPGKPAKPRLSLMLAAPTGRSTLCVSTSMYDRYTKKTINIRTPVPL